MREISKPASQQISEFANRSAHVSHLCLAKTPSGRKVTIRVIHGPRPGCPRVGGSNPLSPTNIFNSLQTDAVDPSVLALAPEGAFLLSIR